MKNKKSFLILLFLGLIILPFKAFLHAQIIDNSKGEAFTEKPFFNPEYVQRNNIKTLTGKIMYYKLGNRPQETNDYRKYFFTPEGLLEKIVEISGSEEKEDTLVTVFEYNEKQDITAIRKWNNVSFNSHTFEFDEEGNVILEEKKRTTNKNEKNPMEFELGDEFIVSSEKSVYREMPQRLQRTIYNSAGNPYKQVYIYYDSLGMIDRVRDRIIRTNFIEYTEYIYNEKNYVDSLIITNNSRNSPNELVVFEYDENDNLQAKKTYKGKQFIEQVQIIYSRKTGLLNDVIIQDMQNNMMRIFELRNYTYYE